MDMEYRRLGRSGLKVSAFSLGSWVTFHYQVDDSLAVECMKVAYDAGVNFFDNAEAYAQGRSEEIMGRALKKLGFPRDSYCVSSKVFWGGDLPTQRGLSRKHVHDACHAAMRRLDVDYLDLFFCHRPDHETPIEETVRAMGDLVRQGKVLYWGTSEWSADQIARAHGIAISLGVDPPTMEQPQYNMLHRERVEREYLQLYDDIGLGTTIWSPLASGILTGKYNQGVPDDSRLALPDYQWLRDQVLDEKGRENLEKVGRLQRVAEELDTSLAKLALAWCLRSTRVSTVILGASKVDQLRENLDALELLPRLSTEVLESIETILDNTPEPPATY